MGLTGTVGAATSADVSTDFLRGRRAFGAMANAPALSARAVGWFVLTARRGRTPVDVSFAAVLDFVRRGKRELSELDDWRDLRGWFVEGTCASWAELVVRRGIASEHYALATGRARMVMGEWIRIRPLQESASQASGRSKKAPASRRAADAEG